MTSTANKGAVRAAATARRTRHAQRTPLPGDTSRPVIGNPTAEAIKDELSKAKPTPRAKKSTVAKGKPCPNHCGNTLQQVSGAGAYKCSKCGLSEAPSAVHHDTRTFGDQTDTLAARVREMRDGGATWIGIATELGLSEGKTGCSQARRLYRSTNEGQSAPRVRVAKPKAPRTVRVVAEDGSVTREAVTGDGGVPMLKVLPVYHLHCVDERRVAKGRTRLSPVNVFPIAEAQARSLEKIFGEDGYSVNTVRHESGGTCCTATKAAATPRPKKRTA